MDANNTVQYLTSFSYALMLPPPPVHSNHSLLPSTAGVFTSPRVPDVQGEQRHSVLPDAAGHGPHTLRGQGRGARLSQRAWGRQNQRPESRRVPWHS